MNQLVAQTRHFDQRGRRHLLGILSIYITAHGHTVITQIAYKVYICPAAKRKRLFVQNGSVRIILWGR